MRSVVYMECIRNEDLSSIPVCLPSVGDTEAGFHPYLSTNGREVMCFTESLCRGYCVSNSRQKITEE